MPNKYSHAWVLTNYQKNGLTEFAGPRDPRPRPIATSFKKHYARAFSSRPLSPPGRLSEPPSCQCCASSRRLRLESLSPPPTRRRRDNFRIHAHQPSDTTEIYVPSEPGELSETSGSIDEPWQGTVSENALACVSPSSTHSLDISSASVVSQAHSVGTSVRIPTSSRDNLRFHAGLEGHEHNGLPSVRKIRNHARRKSNETEIYAPQAPVQAPVHMYGSTVLNTAFPLNRPLSPPLTPIRPDCFPTEDKSDPVSPSSLHQHSFGTDQTERTPAQPAPTTSPPDLSEGDSRTTAAASYKGRSRTISVSTRRSSINAPTSGPCTSFASGSVRTRATSTSSNFSGRAKSTYTFDLTSEEEDSTHDGRSTLYDDLTVSDNFTLDDLETDLEPLPPELPSDFELLCTEIPTINQDELLALKLGGSFRPNQDARHRAQSPQSSPRRASFDSAAPPPISRNPPSIQATTTTTITSLNSRPPKRLFPFRLLSNSNSQSQGSKSAPVSPMPPTPNPATPFPEPLSKSATNLLQPPPEPRSRSRTPLMSLFKLSSLQNNRPSTPVSIPYSATAPGPPPASVAISRTGIPSIPTLFSETRGQWPPDAKAGWVDIGGGEMAEIGSPEAEEALQGMERGRSRQNSRLGNACSRASSVIRSASISSVRRDHERDRSESRFGGSRRSSFSFSLGGGGGSRRGSFSQGGYEHEREGRFDSVSTTPRAGDSVQKSGFFSRVARSRAGSFCRGERSRSRSRSRSRNRRGSVTFSLDDDDPEEGVWIDRGCDGAGDRWEWR